MEHTESPSSRSSLADESTEAADKGTLRIERDYYVVLEVPPNASGEHIGVSFNRIYNQMIALQHSGPQTEDAAASFKELTEAYEVLRDPSKRKIYDKRNQPLPPPQPESIVGRAFGAIVSRFGAPTTSTTASSSGVAADVLDTVGILCQQGGIEGKGPPMDPRVGEISWGVGIEGKVDRQAACYYRLSVTSDDVDNGFIIHCKSAGKDKFKVMMFESSGRLLYKEECSRSADKQSTEATLFFVSYDVINPEVKSSYQPSSPTQQDSTFSNFGSGHEGDSTPSPTEKRDVDREAPHSGISNRIDSIIGPKRSVTAGQYLIIVYGDNIMVKTSFSLVAVMARNEAPEVSLRSIFLMSRDYLSVTVSNIFGVLSKLLDSGIEGN